MEHTVGTTFMRRSHQKATYSSEQAAAGGEVKRKVQPHQLGVVGKVWAEEPTVNFRFSDL